jgi:hypothetical protein
VGTFVKLVLLLASTGLGYLVAESGHGGAQHSTLGAVELGGEGPLSRGFLRNSRSMCLAQPVISLNGSDRFKIVLSHPAREGRVNWNIEAGVTPIYARPRFARGHSNE